MNIWTLKCKETAILVCVRSLTERSEKGNTINVLYNFYDRRINVDLTIYLKTIDL